MCVALLALFVAMGGSAYAAKKITAKNIGTGAVGTRAVKNGSLAGTDIRGNSLGPATIAEQGLDTRKFKTVPTAHGGRDRGQERHRRLASWATWDPPLRRRGHRGHTDGGARRRRGRLRQG